MMSLKKIILWTSGIALLNISLVHAVCIKNFDKIPFYYEIKNVNDTRMPHPKVKFYKGVVSPNEKKCHAHSSNDPDSHVYRQDVIQIFKTNDHHKPVCDNYVQGYLNTLRIDSYGDRWICWDNHDEED